MANPWDLSAVEWETLGGLLAPAAASTVRRGRPRLEDSRPIAEACLFRSFHSLSTGRNRCFDWNKMPADFGVSPSTANRRFREWSDSGAWPRFWDALLRLRGPKTRVRPCRGRKATVYPVSDLLAELQRAYHFFNRTLFGGVLPDEVALLVVRGAGLGGDPLGSYCRRSWRWGRERPVDLIAVSAVAVGRGPEAALETLIHEMVHHRNDRCGLVDCTNRGHYHNRHYRDAAVLAGLVCAERHNTYGYGVTGLGEGARRAIARLRPKASLFCVSSSQTDGPPSA